MSQNATAKPADGKRNPLIYNLTAVVANTEYAQLLSDRTKSFTIKARGNSRLKLAYQSGDSGLLYVSVPKGSVYSEEGLNFTGSIYIQSDVAGEIVEIIEWT